MIVVLRSALNLLFELLELLILIDVILSWVYRGSNSITEILHIFTEPFLAPGRKLQERLIPGLAIDLSPILGLFFIRILRSVVTSILGIL